MLEMKKTNIKFGMLIWPALLVALLSLLWLAQELSLLQCDISLGPFVAIAAALALLINEYRR